jgi:hypothetical protein
MPSIHTQRLNSQLWDRSAAGLQDLLLAFVDCVERNGAKLAIPRTVLELDPSIDADSLLPRMSAVGLLPPPGAVGGYGGRGPNIPITVQVSPHHLVCYIVEIEGKLVLVHLHFKGSSGWCILNAGKLEVVGSGGYGGRGPNISITVQVSC